MNQKHGTQIYSESPKRYIPILSLEPIKVIILEQKVFGEVINLRIFEMR